MMQRGKYKCYGTIGKAILFFKKSLNRKTLEERANSAFMNKNCCCGVERSHTCHFSPSNPSRGDTTKVSVSQ